MLTRASLLAAVLAIVAIRPATTHESPIAPVVLIAGHAEALPLPSLRSLHTEREDVGDSFHGLRDDILPIAPAASSGGERTIVDDSQAQPASSPPMRIVAPSAWSGRMMR